MRHFAIALLVACAPKPQPAPAEPIKVATPEMRKANESPWPRRVIGESTIVPDEATQAKIAALTPPRVASLWWICMDQIGAVTDVKRLHSTGFKPYDTAIQRELLTWHYEPVQSRRNCKSVELFYPIKESD